MSGHYGKTELPVKDLAAMIVAYDLGTTGNKASLFAEDGSLVGTATEPYDTDFGPDGRAEQDPHAWWRATVDVTRRLLVEHPRARRRVQCVTFSGQMMGAVFLDAAGTPTRPAIIWADTRSLRECEEIGQHVPERRAYELTGHRLNPTYSLSKIAWVRRNDPGAWARTAHVAQAKDYIALRLTGELVTDPSDASSTNALTSTRARGHRSY